MLVHQADNPNVSYDNAGGYLLLSGADLWHSHDLQHWQLKVSGLIPLSNDSPVRPSSECLCMFKWNGWHYIIGGRSGFWMSRNQKGPYWEGWDRKNTDVVKPRWDIYEGLLVPMVAEFRNNRRILAGFTGRLYGGYLVFRKNDSICGRHARHEMAGRKAADLQVLKSNIATAFTAMSNVNVQVEGKHGKTRDYKPGCNGSAE